MDIQYRSAGKRSEEYCISPFGLANWVELGFSSAMPFFSSIRRLVSVSCWPDEILSDKPFYFFTVT
jgi:hypothetical protein